MASKKQTIVIKKVIVQGGGHHGGSWKVALADFMTAMMCFFLVMWLLGQNEETKKAISDYFSTPSMIEYNYQNYGAEVTLEKLFLDFVNEPMKAVQSFFEPADKTPNLLDMGSAKVVSAFMADKLTDVAKNVNISKDALEFDIPDHLLFEKGSAKPKANFVNIMEKLVSVTSGLKDAEVKLISALFIQAVQEQTEVAAEKVAQARLELVKNKVAATFEHPSNAISDSINVKDKKGEYDPEKLIGFIHVKISAKESASTVKAKNSKVFADAESSNDVYKSFATEVINEEAAKEPVPAIRKVQSVNQVQAIPLQGIDPNLRNPLDSEFQKLENESNPGK